MTQTTINKDKTFTKFKNGFAYLDKKAIIKMVFWCIFLIIMVYFTVAFITEKTGFNEYFINSKESKFFDGRSIAWIKNGINNGYITSSGYTDPNDPSLNAPTQTLINAYIAMYKAAGDHFTLINFSLMSFITNTFAAPATDPTTAWTTRSNAIDLAYSYMFITSLIAIVALVMQFYVFSRTFMENHKIKKYNLSSRFPTSVTHFSIFKIKMYADFVINLALVFGFFNFLSTLIVMGYWIMTYGASWIIKKINKNTITIDDSFSQHKSDLMYLIFVMIFQNIYTIIKAIFLSKWGVNLDLIFSIILPIGTITVIVGIFIKTMLSSKVNSVLNAIKGIDSTIATFRTFSYTNGIEALEDFNFVAILPPMIKAPLTSGKITKTEAGELMNVLDECAKFIELHYADRPKEKQYMLYTLLNNITSVEQINELKDNALKLEQAHKL